MNLIFDHFRLLSEVGEMSSDPIDLFAEIWVPKLSYTNNLIQIFINARVTLKLAVYNLFIIFCTI